MEHWHDVGLAACEEKYVRSHHRTLGMPSDMYVLGRMRTPELRTEHDRMTATLKHLLAGPNNLFPGTGVTAMHSRGPPRQTRVGEFNAACVALHLETRDPPLAGTICKGEGADVDPIENVRK